MNDLVLGDSCINFARMMPGNYGTSYSEIYGIDGNLMVTISCNNSSNLEILHPIIGSQRGLLLPPDMRIKIYIDSPDPLQKVKLEIRYLHGASNPSPTPIEIMATDDQGTLLETTPSVLPHTNGWENGLITINGNTRIIDIKSGGQPQLLVVCFYF